MKEDGTPGPDQTGGDPQNANTSRLGQPITDGEAVRLTLDEVLDILGRADGEFTAVCHKPVGGVFSSSVVKSIDGGARVESLPKTECIWFSVNPTAGPERDRSGRGKETAVTRWAGLYLDLDVKEGSFPDLDKAAEFIARMSGFIGTYPSVVIFSGHGFQPVWAIEDGELDTEEKWERAYRLVRRFGRFAGAVGWRDFKVSLDTVWDLARVLRVPEAVNWKDPDNPVGVYAVRGAGGPLTVDRIEELLDEWAPEIDSDKPVSGETISPPEDWQFGQDTCNYVNTMVSAWGQESDKPTGGRHQWAMTRSVRLAAAFRLGCITEGDLKVALQALQAALAYWCQTVGEPRELAPDEVGSAFRWGLARVATFDDERTRKELGDHTHGTETGGNGSRSVAARLVDMACELYELGITGEGQAFGTPRERPHLAMLLRNAGTGLRADLAARYFERMGGVASSQALINAQMVLEGRAANLTPQRLYLRVAEHHGVVYIDMGDTKARVIRIADGQWSVIDSAPITFMRTKLTKAMAEPSRSGDVSKLWEFVNVVEEDRAVLLAVLVATLIQVDVPHVILALFAEHGSAKTSITRLLVNLVDPTTVPIRQPPRGPDDWTVAAAGSWVVAMDNVSKIGESLSDCLCRASTGEGRVVRALYTDGDLSTICFRRCVILNSIDVGAVRPDLADRLVLVDVKRIKSADRRGETELDGHWAKVLPLVFGGLLDLAAAVHKRLPEVCLPSSPRMADFAKVLAAVDAELNTTGLDRYRQRGEDLIEDALSANSFIESLRTTDYPVGDEPMTAAQLLVILTPRLKEERPRNWPRTPREVTSILRRYAPGLRQSGWTVEYDDGHNKGNTLRWTLVPPTADGEGNGEDQGEDGEDG